MKSFYVLQTQEKAGLSSSLKVSAELLADEKSDSIWLGKLINEFHYTPDSAKNLKVCLKGSYQHAYQYCQSYKLNKYQIQALHQFTKDGLTKNYLCGRDEFNHPYHCIALKHLLSKKNSIAESMKISSGLTEFQVNGIIYDVPKEERISDIPGDIDHTVKWRIQEITGVDIFSKNIVHSINSQPEYNKTIVEHHKIENARQCVIL